MMSCNPKKYRKSYAWYVITLGKSTLNLATMVEIPFLSKFGPKIQNCLFKLKFDTKSNSNTQNSLHEYPFCANLVQKIKIVSLEFGI